MSRKLRYVNEHQRCLLAGVETELESARLDLVRARGSSVADRLSDSRGDRGTRQDYGANRFNRKGLCSTPPAGGTA